ncbi:hypothetical protein B0H67DRAFT_582943 [Lasiosphaeris hirsuta]|uniref:Uncharacterized protein n=1 Tax=Lasiosphaeris hirsuta TaxID=260670 RepID=A0AA40DYL4_9PEZI|nr:hypothetical protein B0H67DRAFT_582943 [Lasiosphaeris hirsuta]
MTSFHETDVLRRFPGNAAMRRYYLPVYPSNPHPDTAALLYVKGGVKLRKNSYINTKTQLVVDYGDLRPYDRRSSNIQYVLDDDSYLTLIRYTDFNFSQFQLGQHSIGPYDPLDPYVLSINVNLTNSAGSGETFMYSNETTSPQRRVNQLQAQPLLPPPPPTTHRQYPYNTVRQNTTASPPVPAQSHIRPRDYPYSRSAPRRYNSYGNGSPSRSRDDEPSFSKTVVGLGILILYSAWTYRVELWGLVVRGVRWGAIHVLPRLKAAARAAGVVVLWVSKCATKTVKDVVKTATAVAVWVLRASIKGAISLVGLWLRGVGVIVVFTFRLANVVVNRAGRATIWTLRWEVRLVKAILTGVW